MPKRVVVDTDVMVDFLRGRAEAVDLVNRYRERIVLPSIVIAELYAGVKGDRETEALDRLFSLFPIVPVTPALARAGGLYCRDYGKSHGVGLADAIVAATAEAEDAELKTLNTRHYPMCRDLKAPYTKK